MAPRLGTSARPRLRGRRLLAWVALATLGGLALLEVLADGPAAPRALLITLYVLVGVVVLVVTGRESRSVQNIAEAAERIGSGDLSAEVPDVSGEFAPLARNLDRMRDLVAGRMADMERERSTREVILSSMQEGILLFDPESSVVYQNDRATHLLGMRVSRLGDLPQPAIRGVVEAAASGGSPQPVEVVVGVQPRTLLVGALPISGGQTLAVLRDVTQARMIDAVRRDFVANASHELKTPVASIQALAETLVAAASNDPGAVPRFAGQLEREALRLSRIVSDLLDLSRLEGETVARADVRLDRLVAEEANRLRDRFQEAKLHLVEHLDRPVAVRGSARDLSLLARNLLENAAQYTRPGGTVEVSVLAEEGVGVLSVRDTGIGIPAREQARIFERFYRVDRARSRETGGTGLGLSIVKHVVENHGGTVEVESELGQGSTFTVRLRAG